MGQRQGLAAEINSPNVQDDGECCINGYMENKMTKVQKRLFEVAVGFIIILIVIGALQVVS